MSKYSLKSNRMHDTVWLVENGPRIHDVLCLCDATLSERVPHRIRRLKTFVPETELRCHASSQCHFECWTERSSTETLQRKTHRTLGTNYSIRTSYSLEIRPRQPYINNHSSTFFFLFLHPCFALIEHSIALCVCVLKVCEQWLCVCVRVCELEWREKKATQTEQHQRVENRIMVVNTK